MPPVTHVFVKVPEPKTEDELPREVPLPAGEGAAAGGMLAKATPGKLWRVMWSTYTRKRITGGDFVLVTKAGKPAKNEREADASGFVRIAPDGSVDDDQRSDEEIAKATELEAAKAKIAARSSFDTSDTKGKA